MSRPIFGFSDVVIVEGNLVGVVVKSWGPTMSRDPEIDSTYNYDVYVRSWNRVENFHENEVTRFIYDKELSDEDLEYYQ